jgi:hypothetical protein
MCLIQNLFDSSIDFFTSSNSKKYFPANKIWFIALFLAGILAWQIFLHCPNNTCNYQDWLGIIVPRLNFLKDAATRGELPLHSSTPLPLGVFYSKRYLAIPDAFISPQYLLLRFLDVNQFVLFHTILFYTIGFGGLLWFRRKFNLSILSFTLFFILFNFNGYILAHISEGHLTWVPYYLFPWFAVLLIKLVDGQTNWHWVTLMASLLFITLLQGGYHQFIWMLFFIGFLAIFMPRHFFILLKTAIVSVLLGMFRFLPLFSILSSLNENKFIAGYPDIQSILYNMFVIRQAGVEESINKITGRVGLWETTLFVGVIGTIFILYFCFIYPIKQPNLNNHYRILLFPALGVLMLSFDRVYQFILSTIRLPIFTGERVVTRFIGLVFVFILLLAIIEFQHWLDTANPSKFSISMIITLAVLGSNDLMVNFREWIIPVAFQRFGGIETYKIEWFVANNYSDEPYMTLIKIGFAITIIVYIFLITMTIREKQKLVQTS